MGLAAVTYLVHGWVAGTDGFSLTQTITIVGHALVHPPARWRTGTPGMDAVLDQRSMRRDHAVAAA
jgi:hypothetical protein